MTNQLLLCKMPRYYETYFEENSESLALSSLAAYLRINGHSVRIFDASLEGLNLREAKEKLLQLSLDLKPLLIGFTIADMTFIESTAEAAEYLKQHGIESHLTIGGHSPTFNYQEILESCTALDSVIRYEGEIPLLELANWLSDNQEWRRTPNLAYRKSNGTIIANPPTPLIADLDKLPFPARDYLQFVRTRLADNGVVSLSASRGCYYNCGFCSIRRFYGPPAGPLWRTRSVENIVSEIITLKKLHPDIKEIVFVDDLFLGSSRDRTHRLILFQSKLRDNNLNLLFSISDRVDNINDEIGQIWQEIGVRQILIGLESGSQEILNKLNKGITLQQQRAALQILEKHDIDPTPSFINFTPWSTLEEMEESVGYFLGLNINLIQGLLNRFQIYDGTPLADKLKHENMIYGVFPNRKYKTIDKRVDNLHLIVKNNFGPYLDIAYRLKLLERKLRFLLFDANNSGITERIRAVKASKQLYKKMMHRIMEEAVELFFVALDACKNQEMPNIEICQRINEKVTDSTNIWLKLIETFETFCPELQNNFRELLYEQKNN